MGPVQDPLQIRWLVDAGEPLSAQPVVVEATAFCGTRTGDVKSIHVDTGALGWTRRAQSSPVRTLHPLREGLLVAFGLPGRHSPPVRVPPRGLSMGLFYLGEGAPSLVRLSADGQPEWVVDPSAPAYRVTAHGGVVLWDGAKGLVAYRLQDGREAWRKGAEAGHSAGAAEGVAVLLEAQDEAIVAKGARIGDGSVVWRLPPMRAPGPPDRTMCVSGAWFCHIGPRQRLWVVDVRSGSIRHSSEVPALARYFRADGKQVDGDCTIVAALSDAILVRAWTRGQRHRYWLLDLPSGEVRWSLRPRSVPGRPRAHDLSYMCVSDERVYFRSNWYVPGERLVGVSLASGKCVWSVPCGWYDEEGNLEQWVAEADEIGGIVYLLGGEGELGMVHATTGEWLRPLVALPDPLGAAAALPVKAGNLILVWDTEGHLAAFEPRRTAGDRNPGT
ncbi:MAG: PQQ-binding-like beta-propeller repeat protein [Armatimonadota bacterium]|jgi:outer membrane protein assembly factor BamB